MQYVQLDVVRYAVMILAAVDKAGQRVLCEVGPHEEPAAYLIPDAPRRRWRAGCGATSGASSGALVSIGVGRCLHKWPGGRPKTGHLADATTLDTHTVASEAGDGSLSPVVSHPAFLTTGRAVSSSHLARPLLCPGPMEQAPAKHSLWVEGARRLC